MFTVSVLLHTSINLTSWMSNPSKGDENSLSQNHILAATLILYQGLLSYSM